MDFGSGQRKLRRTRDGRFGSCASLRTDRLQYLSRVLVLDKGDKLQLRWDCTARQRQFTMHLRRPVRKYDGTDPGTCHVLMRQRQATVLAPQHLGHQAVFRKREIQRGGANTFW